MNAEQTRGRIVNFWRQGNTFKWKACLLCTELTPDQVQGLAEELHVTVQTVRSMRAAGRAYIELLPFTPKVKEYAEALGYSFFATIGFLLQEQRITPREAIEQLRTAMKEGANIIDFSMAVAGEAKPASTPWARTAKRAYNLALKLRDFFGAPRELQETASTFCEAYEAWEGKQVAKK